MKRSLGLLCTLAISVAAQADFPNQSQTPGELITKSHPQLGRLAITDIMGDYVIAIPEIPSSPPGADYLVRALDISNPANPVTVATFGETQHPGNAHTTYKRGNEIYIGGYPNNAIRLEADGSLSHVPWSGPLPHWNRSGVYWPWSAQMWWSYGDVQGNAWLSLDGQTTATWNHLGLTGVIGFPNFMGNLLIYASDQSRSGIATYDVSDPYNPVLLDVFNLPAVHPTIKKSVWVNGSSQLVDVEYGLGGYWSDIYGHYMVFARRGDNPGIQIVDFSDPTNLKLHCEVLYNDPANGLSELSGGVNDPMYMGFQDEYVFAEQLKVNVETCEVSEIFNELTAGIETSQSSRPIGNLLLTGGGNNWVLQGKGISTGGLGVWAHQAAPDNRPPFAAYHIPTQGQTNYPVMAPISVMIPESVRSEKIVVGENIIVREVGGAQVEIDYLLSHVGMLTINPLQNLKPDTTYEVVLVGIEDAVHNAMEEYSFQFSTGGTLDETSNSAPVMQSLAVSPAQGLLVGEQATAIAQATDADGDSLQFRFRSADGESYSPWSASSTMSFTYAEPGAYTLTAQVRDPDGATSTASVNFSVSSIPEATEQPLLSTQMALTRDGFSAWAVNPDNGTIAKLDIGLQQVVGEYYIGANPRSVATDGAGYAWVTLHDEDSVAVVDEQGNVAQRINLGYGAAPQGIVIDRSGRYAYIALASAGKVVKIDTNSRNVVGELDRMPSVRALALTGDGSRLLATRYISNRNWGLVWDIKTSDMTLNKKIRLGENLVPDAVDNGRGVPNYLAAIIIDPEDRYAYVVGKKDNTSRGLIYGNEDLDEDNTVRTFAAKIDLAAGAEIPAGRVDFDNGDSPSALAIAPNGGYLFVAMQGNNQVSVFDRNPETGALGSSVSKITTGLAPQGLLLDYASKQLLAKNFTGRSVTMVDVANLLNGNVVNPDKLTVGTVESEVLSAQVLKGKQIFYNASYGLDEEGEVTGRMSAEGYISCATCHESGGQDGRVYDFTGRGEGLRNNISLNGTAGNLHGNLHWSGNFDEVQDFELDIRNRFLGRGLMGDQAFASTAASLGASKAGYSADLDALAAYVTSLDASKLDRSPYRKSATSMTSQGKKGQQLFEKLGCDSCHSGSMYTDGAMHDVGTLREYSGMRLGGPLPGIMTPSLPGLFNTEPYMHDGSADSIEDIFYTVGGDVVQAEDASLGGGASVFEPDGFSYLRRGAGVRLGDNGYVRVSTDSSFDNRTAYIRVRYGSSSKDSLLNLSVNSRQYSNSLRPLPTMQGVDVAFEETIFAVQLDRGANTLTFELAPASNQDTVLIDDITISTEEAEALAEVHTVVNTLGDKRRRKLIRFLQQLDRSDGMGI
ncbi:Ig-like domain-containing protein [Mangrovimicrobium sediminis]|nr:Ig-like domain-containing protein [Haliea sp. SAOS-164]